MTVDRYETGDLKRCLVTVDRYDTGDLERCSGA